MAANIVHRLFNQTQIRVVDGETEKLILQLHGGSVEARTHQALSSRGRGDECGNRKLEDR